MWNGGEVVPLLPLPIEKTKSDLEVDEYKGVISNERSRQQILARGHKGKSIAGAFKSFKYAQYGREDAALQVWLVDNRFV